MQLRSSGCFIANEYFSDNSKADSKYFPQVKFGAVKHGGTILMRLHSSSFLSCNFGEIRVLNDNEDGKTGK